MKANRLDTAERGITFCMECGAAVREWYDKPECPNSADKRHGPLRRITGAVMADEYHFDCTVPLAELREENERLEDVIESLALPADDQERWGVETWEQRAKQIEAERTKLATALRQADNLLMFGDARKAQRIIQEALAGVPSEGGEDRG